MSGNRSILHRAESDEDGLNNVETGGYLTTTSRDIGVCTTGRHFVILTIISILGSKRPINSLGEKAGQNGILGKSRGDFWTPFWRMGTMTGLSDTFQ